MSNALRLELWKDMLANISAYLQACEKRIEEIDKARQKKIGLGIRQADDHSSEDKLLEKLGLLKGSLETRQNELTRKIEKYSTKLNDPIFRGVHDSTINYYNDLILPLFLQASELGIVTPDGFKEVGDITFVQSAVADAKEIPGVAAVIDATASTGQAASQALGSAGQAASQALGSAGQAAGQAIGSGLSTAWGFGKSILNQAGLDPSPSGLALFLARKAFEKYQKHQESQKAAAARAVVERQERIDAERRLKQAAKDKQLRDRFTTSSRYAQGIQAPKIRRLLAPGLNLAQNLPVFITVNLELNGHSYEGHIKGIILQGGVFEFSPLLESRGVIYQIVPYDTTVSAFGLEAEEASAIAQACIPTKVGKVGIMYWAALYYDLGYASVILTDFKQTYNSLLNAFLPVSLGQFPDFSIRLAEYEVLSLSKDPAPMYENLQNLASRKLSKSYKATSHKSETKTKTTDNDYVRDKQLLALYNGASPNNPLSKPSPATTNKEDFEILDSIVD